MPVSTASRVWFSFPAPNPAATIRLFCLPYGGGGAHIFRDWAQALPAQVELCTVNLPGRGRRFTDPLLTRMDDLIDELAPVMPFADKPFAIFGHSMGALVAFELARRLRFDRDVVPAYLFVSG